MAVKEVMMKLKVDVNCKKCMKKVKKVLSKFPEIRDQTINEKQNLVIIKVVCFDPEKIRDKICCKSEGSIKIIEILPVKKPPTDIKPQPQPQPQPQPRPRPQPQPQPRPTQGPKPEIQPPAIGYPPVLIAIPIGTCYVPCSCFHCCHGRPWACYYGCHDGRQSACNCGCHHGRQSACYCGCHHGRPVYDSYGGARAWNVGTCEQGASQCTTM